MTKAQARQKAKESVAKMTVEERLSQLVYNSPAIERLGIDEYNWWNEGSHGVARAGTATVFPHAIAMGATFDPDLVGEVATPHWQLCSVKPVVLEAGEKKEVTLNIDRYWIKAVTMDGERVDPDGKISLYIGGHQPDSVSDKLLGYPCFKIEL